MAELQGWHIVLFVVMILTCLIAELLDKYQEGGPQIKIFALKFRLATFLFILSGTSGIQWLFFYSLCGMSKRGYVLTREPLEEHHGLQAAIMFLSIAGITFIVLLMIIFIYFLYSKCCKKQFKITFWPILCCIFLIVMMVLMALPLLILHLFGFDWKKESSQDTPYNYGGFDPDDFEIPNISITPDHNFPSDNYEKLEKDIMLMWTMNKQREETARRAKFSIQQRSEIVRVLISQPSTDLSREENFNWTIKNFDNLLNNTSFNTGIVGGAKWILNVWNNDMDEVGLEFYPQNLQDDLYSKHSKSRTFELKIVKNDTAIFQEPVITVSQNKSSESDFLRKTWIVYVSMEFVEESLDDDGSLHLELSFGNATHYFVHDKEGKLLAMDKKGTPTPLRISRYFFFPWRNSSVSSISDPGLKQKEMITSPLPLKKLSKRMRQN